MLKTMALFAVPHLFPFSNCNKESKGLRERARTRGERKGKGEKKKKHREQGWMWAVEAKIWMKKDGHANKEGEMQSKVNKWEKIFFFFLVNC